MFDKKFLKNVSLVVLSNGVKLLASLLNIFILPLIFDFEGYGFYKLFILYVSYIGLFHFGFIDGIYLKFGGVSYESLDKKKFKSYTRFLLYLQFLVTLIIFLYGLLFESGTVKPLFCSFTKLSSCEYDKSLSVYFSNNRKI